MKKIICFSLWGDNYRYTGGALQNIDLAKIYFPDWICRFYVGDNTPEILISKMQSNLNVEIIRMNDKCDWTGMFWRFLGASDPNVDIMICRDVDSRLIRRDKLAVDEWLKSDKLFHIIRDHQYHSVPILGGMWGARGGILLKIKDLISNYDKGDFHGVDQNFLGEKVYPLIRNNALVHDEFFEKKPFPEEAGPRDSRHFVGQAYNGNGSILDVPEIFIQDSLINEKINLKIYDDKTFN